MLKMSAIHTNTCAQTTTPLVHQPPLTPHSADILSTRSRHGSANGRPQDPLLKNTHDAVVHRIQIRRIGWPHLWGMNSGVSLRSNMTVSRHDVISLTPSLRDT